MTSADFRLFSCVIHCLTTFNVSAGATLTNAARSVLGNALLQNPGSRVAFCDDLARLFI